MEAVAGSYVVLLVEFPDDDCLVLPCLVKLYIHRIQSILFKLLKQYKHLIRSHHDLGDRDTNVSCNLLFRSLAELGVVYSEEMPVDIALSIDASLVSAKFLRQISWNLADC